MNFVINDTTRMALFYDTQSLTDRDIAGVLIKILSRPETRLEFLKLQIFDGFSDSIIGFVIRNTDLPMAKDIWASLSIDRKMLIIMNEISGNSSCPIFGPTKYLRDNLRNEKVQMMFLSDKDIVQKLLCSPDMDQDVIEFIEENANPE